MEVRVKKLQTTIYSIYKVLKLQEKFGLDVIVIQKLNCSISRDNNNYSSQLFARIQLTRITISRIL